MNNFEDNLKKLETLSSDIKRTDISLEDALKDFEEGIKLVKGMEKELDEIEAKIQILIKDPDSLTEDEKSKSSAKPAKSSATAAVKAEDSEATSNAEDSSNSAATSNASAAKSSAKKTASKTAKQNDFDGALDLFAPDTSVNGTRNV